MDAADSREIDIAKVAEALLPRREDSIPFSRQCRNPSRTYEGAMERRAKGNRAVLLLLFLCGVFPGLIYWTAHCGYDYYCPGCGASRSKTSF